MKGKKCHRESTVVRKFGWKSGMTRGKVISEGKSELVQVDEPSKQPVLIASVINGPMFPLFSLSLTKIKVMIL